MARRAVQHAPDLEDSRHLNGLQHRPSQFILEGGWRSGGGDAGSGPQLDQYEGLLRSMMEGESERRAYLEHDGRTQMNYVKSNDGWFWSLCVWEGRAFDRIMWPWFFLTVNATIWTVLSEMNIIKYGAGANASGWETFYVAILNTSLAFLLVFRLNRAAERFWLARQNWGVVVGLGRHFCSGVITHGKHDPQQRDEAIKWTAAFAVASMQFMRGYSECPAAALLGILSTEETVRLHRAPHPPLYASCQIRSALQELFCITVDTPPALAHLYAQQLQILETSLNGMMDNEGAMERIRSTPLPLVYVTHLRTFLLLFLLTMPYIWEYAWGWSTIPIVAVSSYALLGLEGASQEVESPFEHDRPNHLNMDAYCLLILSNIQQMLQHSADREIEKRLLNSDEESKTSDGIREASDPPPS